MVRILRTFSKESAWSGEINIFIPKTLDVRIWRLQKSIPVLYKSKRIYYGRRPITFKWNRDSHDDFNFKKTLWSPWFIQKYVSALRVMGDKDWLIGITQVDPCFRLLSPQTRDIHPMLFQCWPTVLDAGPTLKQHWVNVPCSGIRISSRSGDCPASVLYVTTLANSASLLYAILMASSPLMAAKYDSLSRRRHSVSPMPATPAWHSASACQGGWIWCSLKIVSFHSGD